MRCYKPPVLKKFVPNFKIRTYWKKYQNVATPKTHRITVCIRKCCVTERRRSKMPPHSQSLTVLLDVSQLGYSGLIFMTFVDRTVKVVVLMSQQPVAACPYVRCPYVRSLASSSSSSKIVSQRAHSSCLVETHAFISPDYSPPKAPTSMLNLWTTKCGA